MGEEQQRESIDLFMDMSFFIQHSLEILAFEITTRKEIVNSDRIEVIENYKLPLLIFTRYSNDVKRRN
jgi:hypothetical protein